MYKITPILLALLLPLAIHAQGKNDYQWVTGYGTFAVHFGGTRINFNANEPAFTHFALPYHFGFDIPCSISDEEGNLQFYSNGCQIINKEHELIENGDDLSPGFFQSIECDNPPYGYDSYQSMTILPRPGHPGRYVYFHPTIESDISSGKILYTEVDMNANNGKGKVILKNQLLRGPHPIEGAFTSVRHSNGRDWWIIIPEESVNVYNSYLLTPDTILGPFSQNWEDAEAAMYFKAGWNVVISPDGKKFARVTLTWVDGVNRFNRIFLYDFDRNTGALSNPQVLKVSDPNVYASWAAISPNSRFLYLQIAQNKLYQYDLHAQDIEGSGQLIAEFDGFVTPLGFSAAFHAMALAPDNKIYMCCTSGIQYYHTIHAPDEPGIACDFRQHDFELPTVNNAQMPNFPNFRLGPIDGSICDTLGLDNLPVAHFRWEAKDALSPLKVDFADLSYYEPATWLWDFGEGTTSQDTSPVHLFPAAGTYQVCLTVCNTNDCNTACREVNLMTVSTLSAQGEVGKFLLSPNPAADVLHLQFETPLKGELVIADLSGRKVDVLTIIEETKILDLPITHLANGIYMLSFFDGSEKIPLTTKFVVLR
ncbi:MAG: PKD domain-containing protein [Saprospiraceae bacterium]|nr:PKD domain-containing protein [Saprospiraceae bacterium]